MKARNTTTYSQLQSVLRSLPERLANSEPEAILEFNAELQSRRGDLSSEQYEGLAFTLEIVTSVYLADSAKREAFIKNAKRGAEILASIPLLVAESLAVMEDNDLPRATLTHFVRMMTNEKPFSDWQRPIVLQFAENRVRDLQGVPFKVSSLTKELSLAPKKHVTSVLTASQIREYKSGTKSIRDFWESTDSMPVITNLHQALSQLEQIEKRRDR